MNNRDLAAASSTTVRVQTESDSIRPSPGEGFVSTPFVEDVTERALTYLSVGYAVHFSGPSGVGKTTLALHVAAKLGRPVALIHGDDEFGSSDLVGRDGGYRKRRVVDNYIHSVLKTEEEMNTLWVDNRLTTACENGYTLIYDEFTRSRPEANNVLLSVLAEKILNLPELRVSGEGYLGIHAKFCAIFTSNPEEYAGTHKTQDALMDRLITIKLGHYDRETEVGIAMAKSGVSGEDAETIVDLVRELRGVGVNNHRPTIRASIAIAKVLARRNARAHLGDPVFKWVCRDVLNVETAKVSRGGESLMPQKIEEVIRKVCERQTRFSGKLDSRPAGGKG
ncbi:MAG: gas vesicle protein GvpN [Deltaproteobacteria bacterium]|nr:gas vesicle protein GvpN [Deltaproteobacteria bacterium]